GKSQTWSRHTNASPRKLVGSLIAQSCRFVASFGAYFYTAHYKTSWIAISKVRNSSGRQDLSIQQRRCSDCRNPVQPAGKM
ncbi:MAG: hypothetical protein AB1733_25135, partial [Thermodesulfobacteriota bacterium]